MNILITLGVAASSLCVLWAVQSVVLKLVDEPLAWPLRFTTRSPLVRLTCRVMTYVSWLIILVGTPLALGLHPLDVLHQAFPTPIPWRDMAIAFSIVFFPSLIVYALWIKAGWVRVQPRFDRATRRSKLLRRFVGPWLVATLEEAVFRGILLEQLIESFPQSPIYTLLAIILSSAAFSAVHFIKPLNPRMSVWQAAYGLFIIGCLLGVAYVIGGRSLWLPIVMHAAVVFVGRGDEALYRVPSPSLAIGLPRMASERPCRQRIRVVRRNCLGGADLIGQKG